VPAKCGILHSDIEPRNVYAAYVLFTRKLHQTVDCVRKVVQVPRMVFVGSLIGMDNLLTFPSEAGAECRGGYISCILNLYDGFNLLINHLPVFTFYIDGVIRRCFIFCILKLVCENLKLFESQPFFVLVEWSGLSQLLQYLVSSW